MIKFGMSLPQIFSQLVKGYKKVKGIKPEGLDLIKIKQEAMQRFKDMNKVVDMGGRPIDTSKGIMGGTQVGQKGIFDNLFNRMQSQMGKNIKEVKTKNRPDVYDLDDYDTTNMSEIKKEIIRTETKLGNLNPESKGFRKAAKELGDKIIALKNKLRDDKAMGGRIGLKEGEGIMQMASAPDIMDERNEMSLRMFKKPIDVLTPEEMDILEEEIMRLMEKFSSAPDPMDERNELSLQLFKKPIDLLTPEEMDLLNDEIERLMQKFSKVDRDAPSITLADGGRAAFKDGKIAGFFKSLKPFSSKNKYTNQLEGILYGSEGLSEGLQLLSQLPFMAEGGRIGYKDGPKDPKRRTFMKAAAGLASLLPFGIGKGVKMAAPVVTKAAEISGPALAKLVETVMSAGKLISVAGKRVKEMVTKKKLGKVEVTEDIQDGSYIIKKDGKEIYYKPGRQDEMGFEDDIIEVIEKRIQKAGGGGISYMLGE